MAQIRDLKLSISEMPFESAVDVVKRVRFNRRLAKVKPKAKTVEVVNGSDPTVPALKKARKSPAKSSSRVPKLTPEMAKQLLEILSNGSKTGESTVK